MSDYRGYEGNYNFTNNNRGDYETFLNTLQKNIKQVLSEDYLSEIALETGFCKRGSKFTPIMFFDILLYNSSSESNKSLNQLTIEVLSEHGVSISKQGIDKRFGENSVLFIKKVFERYLKLQIQQSGIEDGWFGYFKRVRIKDSTKFDIPKEFVDMLPGSGGSASIAGVCIQYEFDVKSGNILDMTITPANRPDSTDAKETLSNIEKGDLYIRDLGYFILANHTKIKNGEAFFINRLNTKTNVYQEKENKLVELDFWALYQLMKNKGVSWMEKEVFIGLKEKLHVRLIIEIMPDEVYENRIRKINKTNKGKGCETSKEYKDRAKFNLFITNISLDTLPAKAVSSLYKIRWQIELVFKVWKSTFGINKTRKMKYTRWLCLLYAKLILVVINWNLIMVHRTIFYKTVGKILSFDKCFKTLKDKVNKFRGLLKQGKVAMEEMMDFITKLFSVNHWLEKKKNNTGFEKIMYSFYCKSGIYVYF